MIRIYKASKGQLKHREIFDEIKKKIDNGEWKEGKAIPTERELAEHFLSSRTTIRKAIESLKQRGYLHSVHGQGTFTLPARSRENHLLHSFTDDIKARGGVPAQNILEIGYIPLSDIIRKNLELDIHVHTVFCIKRIRYMGSTPLGIQTSWLALNDGQEITLEELLATGSLYIYWKKNLLLNL